MTHSLQTYASALRAMGFETVMVRGRLRFRAAGRTRWIQLKTGEHAVAEAAVRSAVLKIAPGSYAFPRRKMGADSAPIRVNLCNADGEHLEWSLGKSSLAGHGGATYTEAWLNAAVALVEAGMVPA